MTDTPREAYLSAMSKRDAQVPKRIFTPRDIVGLSPQISDHTQRESATLPEVYLDEQISPLIDHLVRRGVHTMFSCQGDPDQGPTSTPSCGYISFASPDDLMMATRILAELAFDADLAALAARILGENYVGLSGGGFVQNTEEAVLGRWRYELRRHYEPWSPETDRLRATVRLNFEDVLALCLLLPATNS